VMPGPEPVQDRIDAAPGAVSPAAAAGDLAPVPAIDHDSCRVGSLAVTEPVTVHAIWESACRSFNGGNNRGGGIDFAGFAPAPVRERTCVIINTIGPDRVDTMREMLGHFSGCHFYDVSGAEIPLAEARGRHGRLGAGTGPDELADRLEELVADVREEYFTALAHLLDSRYYRTHGPAGGATAPPGKYATKRRGFVVSMGEDLGAIKISGWTHVIPEYFDFDRFWADYPGSLPAATGSPSGVEVTVRGRTFVTPALHAHVWVMHHRYPTNSPAIDAEGRGNPAGAHPCKAYNVLLMHNGEQVGVDSTSPFLNEFGYVHSDPSLGEGAEDYHGDSIYERKAPTDTEYAAYLVHLTRRVLGLTTEEATQIISPITGIDLLG